MWYCAEQWAARREVFGGHYEEEIRLLGAAEERRNLGGDDGAANPSGAQAAPPARVRVPRRLGRAGAEGAAA